MGNCKGRCSKGGDEEANKAALNSPRSDTGGEFNILSGPGSPASGAGSDAGKVDWATMEAAGQLTVKQQKALAKHKLKIETLNKNLRKNDLLDTCLVEEGEKVGDIMHLYFSKYILAERMGVTLTSDMLKEALKEVTSKEKTAGKNVPGINRLTLELNGTGGLYLAEFIEASRSLKQLNLIKEAIDSPTLIAVSKAIPDTARRTRTVDSVRLFQGKVLNDGIGQPRRELDVEEAAIALSVMAGCLVELIVTFMPLDMYSHVLCKGIGERLQFLDLVECGVDDAACDVLKDKLLSYDVCVEHLNLFGNKVTRVGAKKLSEALKERRCSLHYLNLGRNMIGSAGAISICEALHTNIQLKTLLLHGCGINNDATSAICAALTANIWLTSVSLRGNKLRTPDCLNAGHGGDKGMYMKACEQQQDACEKIFVAFHKPWRYDTTSAWHNGLALPVAPAVM